MGWMWASRSQTPPTATSPSQSAQPPTPPPAVQSESNSDPELAKFLALFQEDIAPKSTPAPSLPSPSAREAPSRQAQPQEQQETPSWFSFTFPARPKNVSTPSEPSPLPSPSTSANTLKQSSTTDASPAGPSSVPYVPPYPTSTHADDSIEDPLAPSPQDAALTRQMSCRDAFDYAFYCNSIGGQWMAVYRYGAMQSCSEKWGDFWFCMRTRSLKGQMKEDAIRQYYKEKEERKYKDQPNSEDVWEPRRHLVREGTFLTHPLPKAEESDLEWNLREIEERKKIRDELGLGPERGTHPWAVKKDS